MTNRERANLPDAGATLPSADHSSTRIGASPNSFAASTELSAVSLKSQDAIELLWSRTGVNVPLIVALLDPQLSVEGATSTTSRSFK